MEDIIAPALLSDWDSLKGLVLDAYLRITTPEVLLQYVLIAASGVVAWWLARKLDGTFARASTDAHAKPWRAAVAGVLRMLTFPVFWLVPLLAARLIANSMGHPFGWVHAAVSLLVAWIVIRLLTGAISRSVWSITVGVFIWAVAALSILHLLDPLTHELDSSAVTIGKARLSGLTVVMALSILGIMLWITTVFLKFIERRISTARALTPTLQVLLIQILRIVLPLLAVVLALAFVGIDLTALAVFSGAIGIGIGLGLQRTAANFIGGLSLIIGQSIKPGDVITYGNTYGWVTDMGARYVTLRTRDGITHLVPNDYFITNGVENWTHIGPAMRLHIPVGLTYESDVPAAIALCLEAAREVGRVLKTPEPVCLVKGFGESSIDLDLRIWIDDPKNGVANVKSAVATAIWRRIGAAEKVDFAFPRREVRILEPPSA